MHPRKTIISFSHYKPCYMGKLLFIFCALLFSFRSFSQSVTVSQQKNELAIGFISPPDYARPQTWWHWTGGNVTKEGITKDLEWMKRVGIGGFQAIDVSFGSGQSIDKKVMFMTPEWLELIRHTAAEAYRLGLNMTMVTSAGWSETGGPWVKPEEAMKKMVWSEITIKGGKKFEGILPQPPFVNGPIRDQKRPPGFGSQGSKPDVTYYADQVVLAYHTPPDEVNMADLKPKLTLSSGTVTDAAPLMDNNLTTKITVPVPTADKNSWLQFEFDKPFTARAFSIALAQSGGFGSSSMRAGYVQASDDGQIFKTLTSLPGAQHDIRALTVRTFSFPETSARFYRVVFTPGGGLSTVGGPNDVGGFGGPSKPPTSFDVTEAVFFAAGRVNRWEDKAGYAPMFEFDALATPAVPASSEISAENIVDLTSKMNKDGTFSWDAPEGNWTILRIGYSLTGAKNAPAMPAGTGYEVDKLNSKHLASYYQQYTAPLQKAMGPLYGKAMKYWLVDSYEADGQNWTDGILDEFKKRRGYDPTPYLPVLTGKIVTSADISDRFLWDYRRTLADLLIDEHYGALTAMAHKQGIHTYSEAAGISLPIIEDALAVKGRMDIPMGEFGMQQGLGSGAGLGWMSASDIEASNPFSGAAIRMNAHQADVREAASASHIYGKKLVGAESWTGGGYEAPGNMKSIGDYWYTQGINQVIFHTSAHQPLDTKPGNTMVGTHINRNITWAKLGKPFMTYLARTQFMLQQGSFIGDIAYYLGEGIPSAVPYWEKISPEPPAGYDYDFINTEILLDSASVKDGKIVLANGQTYQILVLPETAKMTPHVLNKIRDLVAAGATVVGPKPTMSPSLAGYPSADATVSLLANEIWGDADGRLVFQHAYKQGKVYWGIPLEGILASKHVAKDVDYTKAHFNTTLTWIHRKTSDADIYFISNRRAQGEDIDMQFRVSGKAPELWHADGGTMEPLSYAITGNATTIPLHLDANEAVFVVFSKPAATATLTLPKPVEKKLEVIKGSWAVDFPTNLGGPGTVKLDSLISWPSSADTGIKYFSGTASYTKTVNVKAGWQQQGAKMILDLGKVSDIAEVMVNGKPAGILWKAPYKIDITNALKAGANTIEIKVTNEWTNRIAGDYMVPESKKVLRTPPSLFGRPSGGLPSGLMGPVELWSVSGK